MTLLRSLLRRAVGLVFLLAGVAKFLSWPEDPYAILRAANTANAGHWVAPFSKVAMGLAPVLIPATGLAMILSGLVQILGIGPRVAAFGELALMACFLLILHRAFPAVILADGAIAVAIVLGTFLPILGRSTSHQSLWTVWVCLSRRRCGDVAKHRA